MLIGGLHTSFTSPKVNSVAAIQHGLKPVAPTKFKDSSFTNKEFHTKKSTTILKLQNVSIDLINTDQQQQHYKDNGIVVDPTLNKSHNEIVFAASDEITNKTNNNIIPTLIATSSASSLSNSSSLSPFEPSEFIQNSTILNFTPNITAESSSQVPEIPAYIRTTAMSFCIVIMLMGVIGNVMVPIVIIRTKDMRNSTNIFLTNLSIADLLVLLVCTPTVLVELNTRPETWVLGHEMCKAVPFIELTVAHASVLTILAISFERYYAICEPLKAGYVCTKTRAILICSLAWGIAALFTSPILWMAEYKYLDYIDGSLAPVCLTQAITIWTKGFFVMTVGLFFLMPLLVLIILYGIIAQNLISNKGPMMRIRPTKPEFSLKARKQVVLMLGAVVLAFFVCLLPFRVFTLWFIFDIDRTILEIGLEKYYNLLYFCRIMWYLNSAINPVLYNLMSTKFRKGFYKLLYTMWKVIMRCITCGHCCGAWHKRSGGINVTATTTMNTNSNTNTNTNTNTTTNTSSSILSRSSNRRSSDEMMMMTCNRNRIQIQMQMPHGRDCEVVAMLHNGNIEECKTTEVVTASLSALNRYGKGDGVIIKSHPQRRLSTSSLMQHHHHNHHVACNRFQTKHISLEEEPAVA